MNFKQLPQNTAQGLGGFPNHDFHRYCSFLTPAAGAAARNQQDRHQKHQRPYRKDRRNQDPGAKSNAAKAQKPAAASTKHPSHAPFFSTSIYRRGCPACKKTARDPLDPGPHRLFFLFLPILQRLQLFIEANIALMAAFLDPAVLHSLQHSAPLLLGVAASNETAPIQIGSEFPERLRQMVFQLQVQLLCFKRGKAGGIHHVRTTGEMVQLHMPGGVPSTAQGCADFPHLDMKGIVQSV